MKLKQPIDIALIGTGVRAKAVYRPTFAPLWRRGVKLVAVCDPVREHADAYAESLGVPAFYSLEELVAARPMEAAVVCAPAALHYSISCYLSLHGIHNLVETPMASTLAQARDMVITARAGNVVMRIADQFFRLPAQRLAQGIASSHFLGSINRVVSTFDHTGFHNNSSWIILFGAHPVSVQSVEHTMPVTPHWFVPGARFTEERFHANFFHFPIGRMVCDLTGNVKGLLGRHPRPGYTQFEGQCGTFVWRATSRWNGPLHQGEGEVRYCSDQALAAGGVSDTVYPIVYAQENEFMKSVHLNLPTGRIKYVNPFYRPLEEPTEMLDYYHAAVAEEVLEFAQVIRGETTSEYTDEDAVMAMMMDVGARESVLREGARVRLPIQEEIESDALIEAELRKKYGVDPMDVEAMMEISVPRL